MNRRGRRGRPPGPVAGPGELTKRERQIVAAILANATTYEAIGEKLNLSGSTVSTHIGHIYQKTGAKNMAQLILMAFGNLECPVRNLPRKAADGEIT